MNRRSCASGSKVTYMAPSAIHYIHPDATSGATGCLSPSDGCLSGHCPELDRTVTELTSTGLTNAHHFKIQIVEKDGHWFALNSAQLELCRRLEKGGVCPKVKVDVVPSQEVPLNVRNLMTLPSSETQLGASEEDIQTHERTASPATTRTSSTKTRLGYQRLGQDEHDREERVDKEDALQNPAGEKISRSDATDDESNDDDNDVEETEEDSCADVISGSDIDWSDDDDLESSEGEWSNEDDRKRTGSSSNSDAPEMTSEDENENNCLL